MTVTPFQPFTASGSLFDRSSATPGATANCGKVFQSQDASVTITTAEGDKVTLSANSQQQGEFATYNSSGLFAGVRSLETKNSFSLSIEGSLNRQELKDIRKAIKVIGRATRELMEGDQKHAAKHVEKLQKLDTIAELQAEVAVKREVSLQSFAVAECPASPTEGTATPEQTTPISAPPLQPAPAETNGTAPEKTETLLDKLLCASCPA